MIDSVYLQIIQTLKSTYHPSKVYLFGSYAWGNPTPDSDIDLLVIVPSSLEKFYKRPVAGYHALRDLRIPKDILVYTDLEFQESALEPSSLCYKILKEGKLIYESLSEMAH